MRIGYPLSNGLLGAFCAFSLLVAPLHCLNDFLCTSSRERERTNKREVVGGLPAYSRTLTIFDLPLGPTWAQSRG